MKISRHLSCLVLLLITILFNKALAADTTALFKVGDYGAVADGKTLDTPAIQKAIDACNAAGGGQVLIPAGKYMTGPIQLKSNVDLHVDAGATVTFSRNFDDYPLVATSFEGHQMVECQSPISGDTLENVSITGGGTFDGNGDAWRPVKKMKLTAEQWAALVKSGGSVDDAGETWYPSDESKHGINALAGIRRGPDALNTENYVKYRPMLRPALLLISNSKKIRLEGLTFRNSPNWNLHLYCTDDIVVHNVTIFNYAYAQNGDGIDVDSCRNVVISDCNVNAGDDAICMKSGRDEEGRKLNRPTENVTVTNCTIGTGHGGITIGSEMSGGVRNITVSHCVMNGTDCGIRCKSTRGRGGIVENITISDVKMTHIIQQAIDFNLYYQIRGNPQPEAVSERTPRFRNFKITNLTCDGAATALNLTGLPEMPLEDISIENANITADKPGQIVRTKGVTLQNVQIHCKTPDLVHLEDNQNLVTESVQGLPAKS